MTRLLAPLVDSLLLFSLVAVAVLGFIPLLVWLAVSLALAPLWGRWVLHYLDVPRTEGEITRRAGHPGRGRVVAGLGWAERRGFAELDPATMRWHRVRRDTIVEEVLT